MNTLAHILKKRTTFNPRSLIFTIPKNLKIRFIPGLKLVRYREYRPMWLIWLSLSLLHAGYKERQTLQKIQYLC